MQPVEQSTHALPAALQVHVPEFNSLIAFRIPRWHAVTPVTTAHPRYSVRGRQLDLGQARQASALQAAWVLSPAFYGLVQVTSAGFGPQTQLYT
jgi:Rps23 Pro-64 3,4-dihydroxylase Tpa1-like proline 4-hydroxylase